MAKSRKKNSIRKRQERRNIKQKYGSTKPEKKEIIDGSSQPNLDEVISQADAAIEASEIDMAVQLYSYASINLRQEVEDLSLAITPNQTTKVDRILKYSKVLSTMAEAKVTMGDVDGARLNFSEAMNVLIEHESMLEHLLGCEKEKILYMVQWKEAKSNIFLYVGQLSSEKEALKCFKSAIDELNSCAGKLEGDGFSPVGINEDQNYDCDDDSLNNALFEIRQQLCGAYCSKAELYLTDLCYEADAESQCEAALELALLIDNPKFSPDALQAMANLRLSQNRGKEAISFILEAYSRMKIGCEAMSNLVGLPSQNHNDGRHMIKEASSAKEIGDDGLKAANTLPGFEFRCQSAKILMECSSLLKEGAELKEVEHEKYCCGAAIHILGSLLAENDEVAEIWFLLGCAFSATKNTLASKYYFQQALEMLRKVKDGMDGKDACGELQEIQARIQDVERRILELDTEQSMNEN